jgi:hypothetical protein
MKNLLILMVAITLLIGCTNESTTVPEKSVLRIHQGQFAFCGASSAVPTGKKITIQGKVFDEGCAICPVLNGPSISNLAMYGEGGTWGNFNVENSFETPDGTNKTVDYNLTGTSLTGGRILASGFFSATNQGSTQVDILKEALFKTQLERNGLTGTPFELTIIIASNGGGDTVLASMDWEEISR